MSVGVFNGAMAKAREVIARLRYEADRSALDEAASVRARELDADEYAARVSPAPASSMTDGDDEGAGPQRSQR